MRIHRVGTFTLGIVLIIFGTLFMLNMFFPGMDYVFIFRLWPIMLISLGFEILIANMRSTKSKIDFVYDKGAVLLMIILSFFSMSMAAIDFSMRYYGYVRF